LAICDTLGAAKESARSGARASAHYPRTTRQLSLVAPLIFLQAFLGEVDVVVCLFLFRRFCASRVLSLRGAMNAAPTRLVGM
jgi:hypothetical protein